MNLQLTGTITLRSSLAHGAFEAGAIVTPFRREPVLQRDADGLPRMAAYASLVSDPVQRETLRQYAQRLLRIVWQSRSDATQWTYSQLAERVAVASRMKHTLADLVQELLSKLGNAGAPVYFNDDAEFLSGVLAAADSDTLLTLLRSPGERLLIVARMQAESAARFEKRPLPGNQMSLLETENREEEIENRGESALAPISSAPIFSPTAAPDIAFVPVYSGNALRNGVVRRGAARFLLDRFGWRVPLDSFRALFVGGALLRTGDRSLDITQRRQFLDLMPLYGLVGGPFNRSDMVEGSVKAGKAYPLVREALPVLPSGCHPEARRLPMQSVINTELYSRREDARLAAGDYLRGGAVVGGADGGATSGMLFEREVLIAGARLSSSWVFHASTELQVGAWISGWVQWAQRPTLGGASQMGHGLADVEYRAGDAAFLAVREGAVTLSADAQRLFDAYQTHLDAKQQAIQLFLQAIPAAEDTGVAAAPAVDGAQLQADFESAEED